MPRIAKTGRARGQMTGPREIGRPAKLAHKEDHHAEIIS
tara:strand:- start:400 stop:516 length:117 start_codon:yes stop_codon:yes gene_type:complete